MKEKTLDSESGIEISAVRQNTFANLNGHAVIFELLQNGMFHLKQAIQHHDTAAHIKEKLRDLFESAFKCLALFCKENESNQKLLSERMKLFLTNLDLEIGQIELVCEICRDNKYICETYGNYIIDCVLEAIENNGRRAIYLEPLIVRIPFPSSSF